MPEKRKRNAGRRRASSDVVADGLIGRTVDQVFDNPAMSGGLFVMALTATAIVSNAMFLQNARHPEPLFATRPPLLIERHVPDVRTPAPIPPRRENDTTGSIAPPLPRAAPIAAPAIGPIAPPAPVVSESEKLLREIQTVLADRGLYLGSIDGMYGNLSRSAIVAYQKAAGLEPSGQPTAALLEHMKTAPQPAATRPLVMPTTRQTEEAMAERSRLRYQRVQTALNRIGYGPVAVDGKADEETANAIRRFELDNGLPISGVAGDRVIDRMIAIGALPAT